MKKKKKKRIYSKRKTFIQENPLTPDLYITQEDDVKLIFECISHYRGLVNYDPCAGLGTYGKVIHDGFSDMVIEYDLYYGDFEKKTT
jgi:hypothetical protein